MLSRTGSGKYSRTGVFPGFSVGLQRATPARDSSCLISAAERPAIVVEKLQKEIQLERIAGPFIDRPFDNLQCSPIEH